MGRNLLIALLFLAGVAQARPGAVRVFVFAGPDAGPQAGVVVRLGPLHGTTDAFGTVLLQPPAGQHPLQVGDATLPPVPVVDDVLTEALVTLRSGAPRVDLETRALAPDEPLVAAVEEGPTLLVAGEVRAEADDRPIAGARVFVRGRPETAVTDAAGRFGLAGSGLVHGTQLGMTRDRCNGRCTRVFENA